MRAAILLQLLVLLCLALLIQSKKKIEKAKPKPRPKPPKLNTDSLPTLPEILEKLGLSRYMPNLIRMGVGETRLLVRLSSMDFQLMQIEWDISDEEVGALKIEVAALVVAATVPEEVEQPEQKERDRLTYGRVYLPNAVQSFEYVSASFGGPPPVGRQRLQIPRGLVGCPKETEVGEGAPGEVNEGAPGEEVEVEEVDYQGSIVIAQRGRCTFLSKALHALHLNASGLIVVNSEDRLESPSSGLGIDKTISETHVKTLAKFPVLAFSNTTWVKVEYAVRANELKGESTYIDIVPLQCKSGGSCRPLLEGERGLQEVSWGTVEVRVPAEGQGEGREEGGQAYAPSRSFEFLTSNYGSQLPSRPVSLVMADPIDGCSALVGAEEVGAEAGAGEMEVEVEVEVEVDAVGGKLKPDAQEAYVSSQVPKYTGAAVVVHRGGCAFHEKALQAQRAGAALLVVVDVADSALQRMGGGQPFAGQVAIPSVLVTASAGKFLQNVLGAGAGAGVMAEVVPARDSVGADRWIELAFTDWSPTPAEHVMQLEGLMQKHSASDEVVAWLMRRMSRVDLAG
ncbi:hypothetical protein B484DRAFT_454184 [Ochromonadaceae sp. CCMP2298]|nr:hypothetical protein B484DRAFT_454184 [Ochromonadaceae sp. CCMP2298]